MTDIPYYDESRICNLCRKTMELNENYAPKTIKPDDKIFLYYLSMFITGIIYQIFYDSKEDIHLCKDCARETKAFIKHIRGRRKNDGINRYG